MTIKNIIFDLGGVILNIDPSLTLQAFHRLGAPHFNEDFTKQPQQKFFIDYEVGHITSQQFRAALRRALRLELSDATLDTAWNALLLDVPVERLEILSKLKQDYRLFLFSNTNSIHLKAVREIFEQQHQSAPLEQLFEKTYYSHLIGYRKPHAGGFNLILKENNLDPAETVFVDDLYLNIQGAAALGLKTIHINANQILENILTLLLKFEKV